MSDQEANTEHREDREVETPGPLQPAEQFADWRVCLRPDAMELASDFALQFRLDEEAAVASLLLTASHSLGESLQVTMPHGNVSPAFNLLAITPEQEPVWTHFPLRFLTTGLEERVEFQFRTLQPQAEDDQPAEHEADLAIHPEKVRNKRLVVAGLEAWQRITSTITCDNPRPPFACSPVDSIVSLLSPTSGLLRTFNKMSDLEMLGLEESLSGARVSTLQQQGAVSITPARPSFFWQLPEADASALFRQHGEWLLRIPMVVLRCSQPGFPCLDTDAPVLRQINCLSELLFDERHARHGKPRVLALDQNLARPVMKFLDDSAKWQISTNDQTPFRWVADLGLKFSLTLMRLEEESELNARMVQNGLELAKFFARQRIKHLSATGWVPGAENAETADLSFAERKAYLKICKADGLTRADLRRSSHQMTASERDAIVAKLLSIGLIRQDGKFLRQNAA